MRRFILPLALLIIGTWIACSPRTQPATAPAAPVTATADEAVKEPPMGRNDSILTAGYAIYTGKCTRCHAAKPVDNWDQEEWKPILKSMVRKTKLDSAETAQVTAYVFANCKK